MIDRPPQPSDRLAKALVDLGRETSLDAATDRLRSISLQIVLPADVSTSETLQVCALIAAETGVRAFPAGVCAVLTHDVPMVVPYHDGALLSETLIGIGVTIADVEDPDLPTIVIGAGELGSSPRWPTVRAIPRGWAGGASPAVGVSPAVTSGSMGAVLAGAIAVSEVFLAIHHLEPRAATRSAGISTWAPSALWTDSQAIGPALQLLPSEAWLVGLGHLGQAVAWLLRVMPFADPRDLLVALQDRDALSIENIGTSLMATTSAIGQRKTRIVDTALQAAGYRTLLVERRADERQRLQPDEPRLGIAGLDSAAARQPLSSIGWSPLIDMGIGAGAHDFTQIIVQRLSATRLSHRVFDVPPEGRAERLLDLEAYRDQIASGHDRCGVLQAAGQAVGTAFVGAVSAVLALAEIVRPLHEGVGHHVLVVDLRDPCALNVATADDTSVALPAHARARSMRDGQAGGPDNTQY